MSIPQQLPIRLRVGKKTDVRSQFAALCFRNSGADTEICLITSRGTGRWVLPKGWPMHKITPASAAAREAWEEAGLTGVAFDHCLGAYSYIKPLNEKRAPVIAMVYPLHVISEHAHWPERKQRKRQWFPQAEAARLVAEPELQNMIRNFDPSVLGYGRPL